MTGTLIQIWFNPRVVTQTWLLLAFSAANWILVFVLEGFVYPYQSKGASNPCALATSTNCLLYDAIPHTYYQSALYAGVVIVLAILSIYVHSHFTSSSPHLPDNSSVLRHFNMKDIHELVTSTEGCIRLSPDGVPMLDTGVLTVQNLLQVSNSYLARASTIQYELLYHAMPSDMHKMLCSRMVGSLRVFEIRHNAITHK
ncbi:hypothetical protein ACHHYP_17529, partial [Achlya hypogyna]